MTIASIIKSIVKMAIPQNKDVQDASLSQRSYFKLFTNIFGSLTTILHIIYIYVWCIYEALCLVYNTCIAALLKVGHVAVVYVQGIGWSIWMLLAIWVGAGLMHMQFSTCPLHAISRGLSCKLLYL